MQRGSRRSVRPLDFEVLPPVDGMSPVKATGDNSWTWVQAVDAGANSAQTWLGGIDYVAAVDGTVPAGNTINNQLGPTLFASTYSIFANNLKVGAVIRVRARGVYGTALSPTLQLRLLIGGNVVLANNATAMPASVTAVGWELIADLIVVAIGVGGSFEVQGHAIFGNVAANGKGADVYMLRNTAPIAIPTNASLSVRLDATWGAANVANTITLRIYEVDVANP